MAKYYSFMTLHINMDMLASSIRCVTVDICILSLGALKCCPPPFNTILNDVCFILLIVAAVANGLPLSKCIVSRRHFVTSVLHLLTVYQTALMVNVWKTKSAV